MSVVWVERERSPTECNIKSKKQNLRLGSAQPNLRTVFPGDHSRLEPPDPIPNSEVKRTYADDSVGFPHVKVGHRQVFILKSDVSRFLHKQ